MEDVLQFQGMGPEGLLVAEMVDQLLDAGVHSLADSIEGFPLLSVEGFDFSSWHDLGDVVQQILRAETGFWVQLIRVER